MHQPRALCRPEQPSCFFICFAMDFVRVSVKHPQAQRHTYIPEFIRCDTLQQTPSLLHRHKQHPLNCHINKGLYLPPQPPQKPLQKGCLPLLPPALQTEPNLKFPRSAFPPASLTLSPSSSAFSASFMPPESWFDLLFIVLDLSLHSHLDQLQHYSEQ